MCGMKIVPVNVTKQGEIDMEDLLKKCVKHGNDLAAIMVRCFVKQWSHSCFTLRLLILLHMEFLTTTFGKFVILFTSTAVKFTLMVPT